MTCKYVTDSGIDCLWTTRYFMCHMQVIKYEAILTRFNLENMP